MPITRAQLGVVLLLVYAAVSDARWIYRAAVGLAARGQDDPITRYERRFRELKAVLPSRGLIGYVGDALPENYTSEDFKRFVLTEYGLAPLVVVNDTLPDLVVGNLASDSARIEPPPGFQLVRQFGDGVWLFRRVR